MILFVVLIVFNVINGMIQKAREAAQPPPPLRVVRKGPPNLAGAPQERSRRDREERPQLPGEPAWAGEGKTLERHGYDSDKISAPLQLQAEEAACAAAVTNRLEKVLNHKDDLVAAFIFHEILLRPRSMQRR